MRAGMQPFEALPVLTQAVVEADGGATRDAAERRTRFHAAVWSDMQAFAQGEGEVPVILKRSGTASEASMRRGRQLVQFYIGKSYQRGSLVAQDEAQALQWFRRGAMSGFGPAQLTYAAMREEGKGEDADPVEAFVWYTLAAARKVPTAQQAADRVLSGLDAEQRARANARMEALSVP